MSQPTKKRTEVMSTTIRNWFNVIYTEKILHTNASYAEQHLLKDICHIHDLYLQPSKVEKKLQKCEEWKIHVSIITILKELATHKT
jgi:hypothetical protein